MVIGKTCDNKIKITTDNPKGLRVVNCVCCNGFCQKLIAALEPVGIPPRKPTSVTWNLTWPFGTFDPELDYWNSTGLITAEMPSLSTGSAFKCDTPEDPLYCFINFTYLYFGLVGISDHLDGRCLFYIVYEYVKEINGRPAGGDGYITIGPFTTEEFLTSHTIEFLGYTATLTFSPNFCSF